MIDPQLKRGLLDSCVLAYCAGGNLMGTRL